jgi:hypothetical protein
MSQSIASQLDSLTNAGASTMIRDASQERSPPKTMVLRFEGNATAAVCPYWIALAKMLTSE